MPTEVQSALLLLRESNAPDTAISLLGLGTGNLQQLPLDVERDNWHSYYNQPRVCAETSVSVVAPTARVSSQLIDLTQPHTTGLRVMQLLE